MTKVGALFGIPTAVVSALLLLGILSETQAGAIGLVIGSLSIAATAYLDPAIPWVGPKPPPPPGE